LNNLGHVVGTAHDGWLPETAHIAFVWQPGVGLRPLPGLPGNEASKASAINDRGQVAGITADGSTLLRWTGTWRVANAVEELVILYATGAELYTTRALDTERAAALLQPVVDAYGALVRGDGEGARAGLEALIAQIERLLGERAITGEAGL